MNEDELIDFYNKIIGVKKKVNTLFRKYDQDRPKAASHIGDAGCQLSEALGVVKDELKEKYGWTEVQFR